MKHEVHMLRPVYVSAGIIKLWDAISKDPLCGEYRWSTGTKLWRYVTCKKCRAIHSAEKVKAKLDKKQGKLFHG